MNDAHGLSVDVVLISISSLFGPTHGGPLQVRGGRPVVQSELFVVHPGSSGSYLAAGPLCCAAVAEAGRRALIRTLALWACLAALVACLTVLPVELPCTVKTVPLLCGSPPVALPEVDPRVLAPAPPPVVVLLGVDSLLEDGRSTRATDPGPCWPGADCSHAL